MKDWERIRKARTDLTDYVIHWTKSYKALQKILQCGYLKPSFAPRYRYSTKSTGNTIKGDYSAVCFTEQTLDCFIISCKELPDRYRPYGIVLNKCYLYDYGGRPVVYGDENLLESLLKEYKYLWVRYNPIPEPGLFGGDSYPADWTHEREWRCRVNRYYPRYWGEGKNLPLPQEGVPILLPMDYHENRDTPDFHILISGKGVWSTEKKDIVDSLNDLKQWILHLLPYEGEDKYLRAYFEILPNAQIISLQEVREHLQTGEKEWARIDTLPGLT